jgi:gamma-glutamylputrescine oxidase
MVNYSYWEKEHFFKQADYIIVGMGITGLQTAINLKEKHKKAHIMVVDRHSWGLGASTRNAGFACFANLSELLDDLQHHDAQTAYKLVKDRFVGLKKLRQKFSDKAIGFEATGSKEIFLKANEADLYQAIDSLQGVNTILYEELGLDAVFSYSSKSPTKNGLGTITNAHEGLLNTGKLYTTLYTRAQHLGILLVGGLEVLQWDQTNTLSVKTKQGIRLSTSNLILCTNGFSHSLVSEDIAPARGQVVVTEKLKVAPENGAFFYDKGYYYWRNIDGRILLGGARNLDKMAEHTTAFGSNAIIVDELKRFLFETILGYEVALEHQWSGIMGMSNNQNKSPILKELEPNVLLAARLGGMGVALSSLVAEEVTNLIA